MAGHDDLTADARSALVRIRASQIKQNPALRAFRDGSAWPAFTATKGWSPSRLNEGVSE
jgi:hypothetical protein